MGRGGNVVVESQRPVEFSFYCIDLTRRVLVAYYHITHVVPFYYFLLKNFPRSRRPVSISHISLSLSEHSVAPNGRHHHLLSSAACPSLISTTASRLTPNGCVLGALQLRSSRVSRSTVSTRQCRTGETLVEKRLEFPRRQEGSMRCCYGRPFGFLSFLYVTHASPQIISIRPGLRLRYIRAGSYYTAHTVAVHSFTHSTDAERYPVSQRRVDVQLV